MLGLGSAIVDSAHVPGGSVELTATEADELERSVVGGGSGSASSRSKTRLSVA